MSILGRYKQQPGEKRKRGIDYTDFLESGETVLTVTPVVTPVTSPVVSITSVLIDSGGKKFSYFAEGGVDGTEYQIDLTVATSLGQIVEDNIILNVEEVTNG